MKILICDDRDGASRDIAREVETARKELDGDWQVSAPPPEAIAKEIRQFFESATSYLKNDEQRSYEREKSVFCGQDVLLLDYGLSALDIFPFRLTAEHIAGYLRAFSNTPYVVSLNKLRTLQGNVDFDLKYLLGDFDTKADLALNTEHLRLPGLWSGLPEAGEFCPWYWPALTKAPGRRAKQIEMVKEHLDRPILEVLGFPEPATALLSRQAIAFLSPAATEPGNGPHAAAKDVRQVTFWDHFQNSSRSLSNEDRTDLLFQGGGNLDDPKFGANDTVREVVARVVAGELEFWFRRDVLGPQRVLMDVPHLQAHFRFRMDAGRDDLGAWSLTARNRQAPYGLDEALFAALPPKCHVSSPWLDGPAVWFPLVEDSEPIQALEARAEKKPGFVFCEDSRRFRDRGSDNPPQRFVTELGKGIDVRFVERLAGYEYSPASLFAR